MAPAEDPPQRGVRPAPVSLDEFRAHAWAHLVRGKADRRHGFHNPVLCTVDSAGAPAARVVVLRHASEQDAEIGCHTDRRAPKLAEIGRDPRVSWVFYDAKARLQVRVSGVARVLTGGPEVDLAWEHTRLFSRRCYLAPSPPSLEVDHPSPNLPEDLLDSNPDAARSEQGRANFAVLRCRVDRLEVLHLAAAGHTRAVFAREGEDWRGAWLAP